MRRVKYTTPLGDGVGHFHKWVILQDTLLAVIETDRKIVLIPHDSLTFEGPPPS